MFKNKKDDDDRKNFLGFTKKTMRGASQRSKYVVGAAVVLTAITLLLSIPFYDHWTYIAEISGALAIGVVIVKILSSIIARAVEGSGIELNKFNFFAVTFLAISILGFVANIFS